MNIGTKVKVLVGQNPDLIGKEATVTGSNGQHLEIMIQGRESMRYTVSAGCVQSLEPVEPVVKIDKISKKPVKMTEKPIEDVRKKNLITNYQISKSESRGWIKVRIEELEEQLKQLKAIDGHLT